ncbi:hypothetical protein D3093_15340 (plasmid) [Azospirillum argentinense]|uniref:Uncharacterized protein n=1 Tax=Azospirillum argentinense TaxID=2970906 RepID=A0A4D8PH23_9PROT|nr:hypothetical protein D3093_15340 [Azospirillum argentinense]
MALIGCFRADFGVGLRLTGLEGDWDRFVRGHVAPAIMAAARRRGRQHREAFLVGDAGRQRDLDVRHHLGDPRAATLMRPRRSVSNCASRQNDGAVRLVFCWSHVRKGFYDLQTGDSAPIASEALLRIAKLYAVEGEIRGRDAEARRQERQARSAPLIAELKMWLEKQLAAVSRKSMLAEAMRCALSRWEGLTLFLDDGRVEFDSNSVECCIRPLALTRKNALFAGSDGEQWATIASLAETCQLNGADPQAWFADVLTKLAGGRPITKLDELLPWAFARQAEPAVA